VPGPAARAVLVYNAARLGLLLVCLVLGALAGLRGFALIVAALVVSGVISWLLLGRQRVAMGAAVEGAVQRGRQKMQSRTAAEDAYDEQVRGEQAASSDSPATDVTRPAG
jgi:hypothetical protein